MCSACGYEHGPYSSCHEVQARNWRADWESEARMYEAPPPPPPVEPDAEPAGVPCDWARGC